MVELSIIIPHKNSPKLLCKLLDSIPNVPEIEVIVVNDKGNDKMETAPVIEAYEQASSLEKGRRVYFFENEGEACGAGACRNIGLSHVTGRRVMFADADDYFSPDFYDAVRAHFNDGEELILFFATSINLATGEKSTRHNVYNDTIRAFIEKKRNSELFLRCFLDGPCCKMISMDLIRREQIRFDEIMYANDAFFSAKVGCLAASLAAYGDVIYCITESGGSLTKIFKPEAFYSRVGATMRKYEFFREILPKRDFKRLPKSLRDFLFIAPKYGLTKEEIRKVKCEMREKHLPYRHNPYRYARSIAGRILHRHR